MNRKGLVCALGLFLAVLLVPVPAPASDEGLAAPGESDLARVRKKIEALRAWQISVELDLDHETSAILFPAMRKADGEGWRIETRNRALIREMALRLQNGDPDPGRINGILDRLQENRMEKARIEDRHLNTVREILSPEDSARYLMFQLRFQRALKEKAAEAFREGRGTQGGGILRSDPDGEDGGSSVGGMGRK